MMRGSVPDFPAEDITVVDATVVVAGTGAAGYCAADQLAVGGVTGVTMLTDRVMAGTSRNAGSDKQTYYKLTLGAGQPDTVREMAQTLYSGGAMDGDIALAEAAGSARAFFHLVEAGVPFPHNKYGEFIGYKTDHDPRQRATSAGPYTSKAMVEALQRRVQAAGVPVLEGCRIVDLVTDQDRLLGLLCWQIDPGRFVLVRCDYLVYATGGPAGMYADSVYPHGQWGAQGAALRAGAVAENLTEWQFGLASVAPRWNVSGSYMQVIPRFVSTNADGSDEREFLADAISDPGHLASLVFLKGYQWPFDVRKARDGSSVIDLLVYRETVLRGRSVFLDFRADPAGYDPARLTQEARDYLAGAGILDLATPLQRLRGLNEPAYQLYQERGVDLATTRLQVAVAAQHNNGGLAGDRWWQSNLRGLFPVGEAAGTHGVYRPGGAALNAGQVGATRAAAYIAHDIAAGGPRTLPQAFFVAAEPVLARAQAVLDAATSSYAISGVDSTGEMLDRIRREMSNDAGLVRSPQSVAAMLQQVEGYLVAYDRPAVAANPASRRSLDRVFLLRDILTSQYVYLSAMADYLAHGGRSRGSVIYTDPVGDLPPVLAGPDPQGFLPDRPASPDCFRFRLDNGALDGVIQETRWGTPPVFRWRDRRPLPRQDEVFETVWASYRATGNID